MNVSSVKNLNGETFSAVQDATLTDVVQTNSGNWQDITAYQSNSANYLTSIPSDLDLNNISANNVVFKDINETTQGEVSTAFTANLTDYGWGIGCGISTDTIGYSSLDMKLSADLPITGTNYITIGVHQEYNEHFAVWKVPYDQIDLMNTLKINEYSAHFQYLANSLTGTDNITLLDVFDEKTSTMPTGVGNFVVSYPGVVTQPLTFSSFYTNYGNTSAMFSGAIDYVSANAGGGGATGEYVPLSAMDVAIGDGTNTAVNTAFSQGSYNLANSRSFSQGYLCEATANSLAQGLYAVAYKGSIAQGNTVNAQNYSQSFGYGTIASNSGMAIGTYNGNATAAFVIGNGANQLERSECFIIDHDGNVSAAGKISANGVELGGYNETVIFNGNISGQITDFTTNEQINNFEKVDVYYCCNDDGFSLLGGNITTYDTEVLTAQNQLSLGGSYTISNGYTCFYNLYYTITNGSAFSCTQSKRYWLAPTDTSGVGNVMYNPTSDVEKKKNGYIYKIVGINRK